MKSYKHINDLMGWLAFLVAAVVYCLTIEPTASFWDCPEFIVTGYKLEVGHPPGAPFFMLVANLFTQLTSDPSQVARMVNTMSALMSAACILFLFWTITHLVRRLLVRDGEAPTSAQTITIMGCGLVGALAYTFSDTFWFSAVEGEVYAFSSLFTAAVFWLILKWEDVADEPHADRWLVLIAYLTGLSIGVHLLNLLCLPAIVLVYYYKKVPHASLRGSLLALCGSAVLVAVVLYGIVPGVVKVCGWMELLCVNVLGLPFNSGVYVYIVLLAAAMIWGVWETYRGDRPLWMSVSVLVGVALLGIPFYGHGSSAVVLGIVILLLLWIYICPSTQRKIRPAWRVSARVLNSAMLCALLIVIGYSSYALIVIRSSANTPMDQNSPEDIFTLGEYLNREQYGTRPLFYGPAYSSQVVLDVNEEEGYCEPREKYTLTRYIRKEKDTPGEKDSYKAVDGRTEYEYAQNMLFPRMYSSKHEQEYKSWQRIKGYDVTYDRCGTLITVNMPTQWENIKFFFSYQLNWMYWRYFMWNFVGRQNDQQGNGEIQNGNWITGIKAIDNLLIGNQDLMPTELRENKGRNVYYGLPLLLGLIGLLWQYHRRSRGVQQFWVVFFLFFMTGIAIVLYLNQTPQQPRERDYAYAGSFYAFAIWIGMGVAGLVQALSDLLQKKAKDAPSEATEGPQERAEGPDNRGTKPSGCCGLQTTLAIVVSVICLLVPIQMGSQTWDDHDRSGRTVCRDFGQNYLSSLQEEGNPVIFTNGDNDTFPLWYNQEAEGFRTDARTCNLSYLQTDWYIDQMCRPAYDSPALPITWERRYYQEGTNEYLGVYPSYKKVIDDLYTEARRQAAEGHPEVLEKVKAEFGDDPYELSSIIRHWVCSDNADLRIIPTDSIVIRVDKEAVRRSGMLIPTDSIPDYMHISLKDKRAVYKSELMMLEIMARCGWERPVYMAISVGSEYQLGLQNFYLMEGLAYRFTPFDKRVTGVSIDVERMYDNLMHKFRFGGIENPKVYIDENAMRMCYSQRRLYAQLANELLARQDSVRAREVLDHVYEHIPAPNVPYDWQNGSTTMAELYYKLGQTERADDILRQLCDKSLEYLYWYLSMEGDRFYYCVDDAEYHMAIVDREARLLSQYGSALAEDYEAQVDAVYDLYVEKMK